MILISDVLCLMYDLLCTMYVVWCQVFVVWCLVSDVPDPNHNPNAKIAGKTFLLWSWDLQDVKMAEKGKIVESLLGI